MPEVNEAIPMPLGHGALAIGAVSSDTVARTTLRSRLRAAELI
jgi:hypothetical protein